MRILSVGSSLLSLRFRLDDISACWKLLLVNPSMHPINILFSVIRDQLLEILSNFYNH